MDCRKALVVGLGLMTAISGCTSSSSMFRLSGRGGPKEDIVHKASTYVAFGEFRARSAQSAECTEAQRQQLRDDARLSYLKAIEVDAAHVPAYVGLARLQQSAEDYAGATAVYAKAIERSPRDGELYFEMGMCQCRGKDWNTGLGSLRKAVELMPANRQYATTLGYTLARAGQWDESLKVLTQVQGEAKAHYDLARMLKHMNQPAQARRHAEAAVLADPKLRDAQALLMQLDAPAAPQQ